MYPFSISINAQVPLNMGAERIVSRQGPNVDFPGVGQKYFYKGAKSVKISFSPLETKKTTFFAKKLSGKCQISKSWGYLTPTSNTHASKISYDKKVEENSKKNSMTPEQ